MFIFRVKYENGRYATIGRLQRINYSESDKDYIIRYITNYLSILNDFYQNTPITEVVISYGIRKGALTEKAHLDSNYGAFEKPNYQRYLCR